MAIRYYDAVLFKDTIDASRMRPVIRETTGWIDHIDGDYVRVIWERYAEPAEHNDSRIRSTGLVIRKADIIELKKIA